MQITLMRHGKPILDASGWMGPVDVGDWIRRYDVAEVEAGAPPASWLLAQTAALVVSSTAPRAQSSVQRLGRTASVSDAIFCEAPLPFSNWRRPRLPATVWVVLFRLMWFMGYARNAEPVLFTKGRAKSAAQRLAAQAEGGPVLLVGHGLMNRFIGQALVAQGWVPTRSQAKGSYWGSCTYELQRS